MTGHEDEETCQDLGAWRHVFIDFANESEDEAACGS
jgi:hypothetical protein